MNTYTAETMPLTRATTSESSDKTHDLFDPFLHYANPYRSNVPLEKFRASHLGLVVIRGKPQAGKTTMLETMGMRYCVNSLKIVVTHGEHPNRFPWAHIVIDTQEERARQASETLDLPDLIENGAEWNANDVFNVLSKEVRGIRRTHFMHDPSLPFHSQIEIFVDNTEDTRKALGSTGLDELIEDISKTQGRYKIRLWVTCSTDSLYKHIKLLSNEQFVSIVLGEQAKSIIDLYRQNPRPSEYIQGLIDTHQTDPILFNVPYPPAFWHDGRYLRLNEGISTNLSWQARLEFSERLDIRPIPDRIILHKDRFYRYSAATSLDISGVQEVVDKNDYDFRGERRIYSSISDDLDSAILESREILARANTSLDFFDVILMESFRYVLREYDGHSELIPKGVKWFNENRSLFMAMCTYLGKRDCVRDVYDALSSRTLLESAGAGNALAIELIKTKMPTSKDGITTLVKLRSLLIKSLRLVTDHFIEKAGATVL